MVKLASANYTGNILESFISERLKEKGYGFVEKNKFKAATYLGQPIYTRQFLIGESIYGTGQYADFLIYHPKKHPGCLVIESKWQQTSGSVDEKFPYLTENVKKYPYSTIILLDGNGYKKQAEAWLRGQIGGRLIHVFNMREFTIWANNGGI